MGDWLKGKQDDASKVLGSDADFPDERPDMRKLEQDYGKARDAFEDARGKLIDAIQDFENAITAFDNGLKTNRAAYSKQDFGLDPKDKDSPKKIAQATKIFMDFFNNIQKNVEGRYKEVEELDKHAIQLRKYNPPKNMT